VKLFAFSFVSVTEGKYDYHEHSYVGTTPQLHTWLHMAAWVLYWHAEMEYLNVEYSDCIWCQQVQW